jgi:hypothetical protein
MKNNPVERRVSSYEQDAINSVVDGIDQLARTMEDKWGVGRLELLVDDTLREKFRRQLRRFDQAVAQHDVAQVRISGGAMRRGWEALDKVATEAGKQPLDPEFWEIQLPDGKIIAFCRNKVDAFALVRMGRWLDVWTVEEVAGIIHRFPEISLAKKTFPGLVVVSARPKTISFDGEQDLVREADDDEDEP